MVPSRQSLTTLGRTLRGTNMSGSFNPKGPLPVHSVALIKPTQFVREVLP